MPIAVCKICSKEFYAKPYFLKRGHAKYCSQGCMRIGSKTGSIVKCHSCGKDTYKTLKALRVSKSKTYFCTKSCQTKWRNSVFVGAKHANWKNGLYAYRSILSRNKIPKVCNICKSEDSRILAIHHIDHDRKNSSIKNLAWLCHNCHFLVHHDKGVEKKFMETLV
jgi:hypothetical protein